MKIQDRSSFGIRAAAPPALTFPQQTLQGTVSLPVVLQKQKAAPPL